MKLLERTDTHVVFSLGAREKALLERLLAFYPMGREEPPQVSRETPPEALADAAALLQDALREQRKDLEGWIRKRMADGEAFARSGTSWRLRLDYPDCERLLQVLNELRVCAWMKLGSPDDLSEKALATIPGHGPLYVIMTLAGQFQMVLIHALDGEPGWGLSDIEEPLP
jgi:hypothetical protein